MQVKVVLMWMSVKSTAELVQMVVTMKMETTLALVDLTLTKQEMATVFQLSVASLNLATIG